VKTIVLSEEVASALECLRCQGFVCQFDKEWPRVLPSDVGGFIAMIQLSGWVGTLLRNETQCDGFGFVSTVFDPHRLTTNMVDELIRDEAASRTLPLQE